MRHGGQTNETTDLDHVGQATVLRAMQFLHAFNHQKVGTNACDLGTHAVQHLAELLQVGFAGGIVNGGDAFSHHSGHHNVGRAGNGGLIQQHVGAFQRFAFHFVKLLFGHVLKCGT